MEEIFPFSSIFAYTVSDLKGFILEEFFVEISSEAVFSVVSVVTVLSSCA